MFLFNSRNSITLIMYLGMVYIFSRVITDTVYIFSRVITDTVYIFSRVIIDTVIYLVE